MCYFTKVIEESKLVQSTLKEFMVSQNDMREEVSRINAYLKEVQFN